MPPAQKVNRTIILKNLSDENLPVNKLFLFIRLLRPYAVRQSKRKPKSTTDINRCNSINSPGMDATRENPFFNSFHIIFLLFYFFKDGLCEYFAANAGSLLLISGLCFPGVNSLYRVLPLYQNLVGGTCQVMLSGNAHP
jgi:hypothetical protein